MKMVLNTRYGGFSLSKKAMELLGTTDEYEYDDDRTNAKLVDVVETLGDEANGHFAHLRVVDIPDDITDYRITQYDGLETVLYVLDGKIYEE